MAFLKYFLPALVVASTALAQNSCSGPTATIQNQGDANALGNCPTYSGDVVIASSVANTISLNGVGEITGSLTCDGAVNLTSLSADRLSTIGKTFKLTGLTILSTLNFASLTKVNTIEWQALPGLQSLTFEQGIQEAGNVTISNTQLQSLSGISLKTVGSIDINNNPYLNQVNVNDMKNITGALNFAANSKDLSISFPNLEFALNMTFRNTSTVSVPSLSSVNGSLGFYSNYFQSFSGPNLTHTGQSLVFDDNPSLTNISLPMLTQIGGGYQIANNSQLKTIDGFQALQVVAGALDFSGNFTNVSLPALKDVRGGFNMQTSGQLSCSAFDNDHSNQVIKGTYICASQQSNPGTAGTTPTGSGSGSSPTKKAAAGRFEVNIPAVTVFTSILAGLLHLYL